MLTIVWDVDDVLNNLMWEWFTSEWKPAHPRCTLSYAGIRENPPHQSLGIELSEYLASLDRFRLSDRARHLLPNPAILAWFQSCGSHYRHVALTARPMDSVPPLAHWLFQHFGNFIRTFAVVPTRVQPSTPVYDRDKGDYLRWLGNADVFVDDSPENVAMGRSLGLRGLLYPQPWNSSTLTCADVLEQLAEPVLVP